VKCKAKKDAADAKARAERDRHITSSYRPEGERRSTWAKRPKRRAAPQKTASTPSPPKFDGDIMGRKESIT